jgi:hypothetical protein
MFSFSGTPSGVRCGGAGGTLSSASGCARGSIEDNAPPVGASNASASNTEAQRTQRFTEKEMSGATSAQCPALHRSSATARHATLNNQQPPNACHSERSGESAANGTESRNLTKYPRRNLGSLLWVIRAVPPLRCASVGMTRIVSWKGGSRTPCVMRPCQKQGAPHV